MKAETPLHRKIDNFLDSQFLTDHIAHTMDFYHPRCIDPQGGFFHYFDDQGNIYNHGQRHLVSSTRFIFNYAAAACHTLDARRKAEYLSAVQQGLDYLQHAHFNRQTRGYAWQIQDGQISDATNHCYGLAFVLLAYSSAVKAGLSQYKRDIEATFNTMEHYFWEEEFGLYADEASADWKTLSSYRGQNANMHSCEALIAAYEATANQGYLDRAMRLADNICNRQAALAQGQIWEHYNSLWEIDWQYNLDDPKNLFRPWGFQSGHFTEWAKLLLILDRYQPTQWLFPRAQQLFDIALERAWDDQHGGICYGFSPQGSICDDDKYFWVQAESFAAAALLVERAQDQTSKQKYLAAYQAIWRYSWEHFIDHQYGAWYRILRADNTKYDQYKSPAGKTDYHTMGACYEVLASLKVMGAKRKSTNDINM